MDLTKTRCKACGTIHRNRETCPTCAAKRREELEKTRPKKPEPEVPSYDGNGYFFGVDRSAASKTLSPEDVAAIKRQMDEVMRDMTEAWEQYRYGN